MSRRRLRIRAMPGVGVAGSIRVGFGWCIDTNGFHAASSGCLLSVKADIRLAETAGGNRLGAVAQVWRLNDSCHRNLSFVVCAAVRPLCLGTCHTLATEPVTQACPDAGDRPPAASSGRERGLPTRCEPSDQADRTTSKRQQADFGPRLLAAGFRE